MAVVADIAAVDTAAAVEVPFRLAVEVELYRQAAADTPAVAVVASAEGTGKHR